MTNHERSAAFCRGWAVEWERERQNVEKEGGRLVVMSSEGGGHIQDEWSVATAGYPTPCKAEAVYFDEGARVAQSLGVVVERVMPTKSEEVKSRYGPTLMMAQPAAIFIQRISKDEIRIVKSWIHASRLSNGYGAMGRVNAKEFLKAGVAEMKEPSANGGTSSFKEVWSFSPLVGFLRDKLPGSRPSKQERRPEAS